jgi:hypothetical protein
MNEKNELNQILEKKERIRTLEGLKLLTILKHYNNMKNAVEDIVKSKKLNYKEKFKRLKEMYLTIDGSSIGDFFRMLFFGILIRLYEDEGKKIAGHLYNDLIKDRYIKKNLKVEMCELK